MTRIYFYLVQVGLLALVYVVSARIGLSLAFLQPEATPVWPPTGIALAVLLLLGYRFWPGVALGAFLINLSLDNNALTALGVATGNTLEALAGASLLHRIKFHNSLDRPRDVAGLVVLAAGVSTTISATIGVTTYGIAGMMPWANIAVVWLTWWIGDAMGALVVAPVLLVWRTPHAEKPLTRPQLFEALVLLTAVFLVSQASFSAAFARPYLIFPFLVWAAFHFKQRGTTIVTLVASGFAIWNTAQGLGNFALADANPSLTLVVLYCGAIAMTGLFLAAAVSERDRVGQAVNEQYSTLRRITNRHDSRTWTEDAVDRGATFYFSLPSFDQGE